MVANANLKGLGIFQIIKLRKAFSFRKAFFALTVFSIHMQRFSVFQLTNLHFSLFGFWESCLAVCVVSASEM
jgi:hypothetical protein